MKNFILIILISLIISSAANSKISKTQTNVNQTIEDGYEIIMEEMIVGKNGTGFIKIFTLQNKDKEVIICTVGFDIYGFLEDLDKLPPIQTTYCYVP